MKFAFVLVFGSFQFGGAPEREPDRAGDRWFARDKAYHFVGSALIQGIGHSVARAAGAEYREASLAAGVLTLGAGVGKELWDRSRGRYFSWKDLTADAAGGTSGAIVLRQIDR